MIVLDRPGQQQQSRVVAGLDARTGGGVDQFHVVKTPDPDRVQRRLADHRTHFGRDMGEDDGNRVFALDVDRPAGQRGAKLFFGFEGGIVDAGAFRRLRGLAPIAQRDGGGVRETDRVQPGLGLADGLRQRPAVPALVFFAATAAVACIVSLPLVVAEIAMGDFFMPTGKGIALIFFIGLLPSFISQVAFIRAVEQIGPARAGVFLNLVPIFGPLLAVIVLGEPLSAYHAVALALVLGGIYIAETIGTRKR